MIQMQLILLIKNIEGAVGIVGDITDEKVKKHIVEKSKKLGVNMIIGGPPCQRIQSERKTTWTR